MTGPALPPIWSDRSAMRVIGTAAALPGEAIATEDLLARVDQRFGLSLRRRGMAIAHRLGINTRHLCRDMAGRVEAPRNRHRNPELAPRAVRSALGDARAPPGGPSYLFQPPRTPRF